jgi:hypothetical protein
MRLEPQEQREVLLELQSHLEDEAEELERQGLPPDEAFKRAVQTLGKPGLLASNLYAVHSRASFWEMVLASLPHFLFAALFALHLWTASIWVALFVISATVTSIVAWQRGQPKWLYPWLGYCLVAPVALWLFSVSELGRAAWASVVQGRVPLPVMAYVGMALYAPLVLLVLWSIWVKVVQRDWLYASLVLLPFPFLTSWLLYLNAHGGPFAYDVRRLLEVDGATALVFLGLGLTTAIVYRVGRRFLRVAILTVAVPLLVLTAASAYQGSILSGTAFLMLLFSISILALPAMMESKLAHPGPHGATRRM